MLVGRGLTDHGMGEVFLDWRHGEATNGGSGWLRRRVLKDQQGFLEVRQRWGALNFAKADDERNFGGEDGQSR